MSCQRLFCAVNIGCYASLSNRMLCKQQRICQAMVSRREYGNSRVASRVYHIAKKKELFKKNRFANARTNSVPIAVKMLAKDAQNQDTDSELDSNVIGSVNEQYLRLDEMINQYETVLESEKLKYEVQFESHSSIDTNTGNSKEDFVVYGTPDSSIPKSNVPCQGCGAVLHCQDPSVPGYLPSQKFIVVPLKKLKETFCQRCILMKSQNIALGVKLDAKDYADIISKIRDVNGLVVLVVDLMDLPNSIFPGLAELVGPEKPIYLVGNKVDLLPKDSNGYLQHCKDTLVRLCKMSGIGRNRNIQHVSLVSGKTKYGVEELVTHMMKHWARQGDVYIVGCTNVGKSTLYNALLSSDYCKSTARDLLARATTCVWPGTTLHLLKFPIVDPTQWRLALRAERLLKVRTAEQEEKKLRQSMLSTTKKLQYASLMGHLGVTEEGRAQPVSEELESFIPGSYTFQDKGLVEDAAQQPSVEFDPSLYTQSRWCYDTPGAVNPNQIINLCTQEELEVLLMTSLLRPRTCVMKAGETLWVSGLGRIDYLEGKTSIYFTVLTSNRIPLHVVKTEEANDFYEKNAGSKTLGIPLGNKERLQELPPLEGNTYTFEGLGWTESMADIVLSSLGWVAITAGTGLKIKVKAYTPGKRGLFNRSPTILPFAINLRGKRIRNTKMYTVRSAKSGET